GYSRPLGRVEGRTREDPRASEIHLHVREAGEPVDRELIAPEAFPADVAIRPRRGPDRVRTEIQWRVGRTGERRLEVGPRGGRGQVATHQDRGPDRDAYGTREPIPLSRESGYEPTPATGGSSSPADEGGSREGSHEEVRVFPDSKRDEVEARGDQGQRDDRDGRRHEAIRHRERMF